MANKFVDGILTVLLWVFVLAVVAGVVWFLAEPIIYWTGQSEFRLYVRVALLLLAIIAFGVLRLYNSQVQNTRVLFKLHQEISKLLAELPMLNRALHNLGGRADTLKTLTQGNTKALSQLSEDAREVINNLKHSKPAK
jgi:type VI protein secretion system component VasK